MPQNIPTGSRMIFPTRKTHSEKIMFHQFWDPLPPATPHPKTIDFQYVWQLLVSFGCFLHQNGSARTGVILARRDGRRGRGLGPWLTVLCIPNQFYVFNFRGGRRRRRNSPSQPHPLANVGRDEISRKGNPSLRLWPLT